MAGELFIGSYPLLQPSSVSAEMGGVKLYLRLLCNLVQFMKFPKRRSLMKDLRLAPSKVYYSFCSISLGGGCEQAGSVWDAKTEIQPSGLPFKCMLILFKKHQILTLHHQIGASLPLLFGRSDSSSSFRFFLKSPAKSTSQLWFQGRRCELQNQREQWLQIVPSMPVLRWQQEQRPFGCCIGVENYSQVRFRDFGRGSRQGSQSLEAVARLGSRLAITSGLFSRLGSTFSVGQLQRSRETLSSLCSSSFYEIQETSKSDSLCSSCSLSSSESLWTCFLGACMSSLLRLCSSPLLFLTGVENPFSSSCTPPSFSSSLHFFLSSLKQTEHFSQNALLPNMTLHLTQSLPACFPFSSFSKASLMFVPSVTAQCFPDIVYKSDAHFQRQ